MSEWGYGSEDAIKQERKDMETLSKAVEALVSASIPLSRIGDGNCGYVIQKVKDGLAAAGIYTESPSYGAVNKKQVISQSLRTQVFERDKYRCLRCGTHLHLRVDHVVPESQGGPMDIDNLQTLCRSCNSWKGVKTIDFRKEL